MPYCELILDCKSPTFHFCKLQTLCNKMVDRNIHVVKSHWHCVSFFLCRPGEPKFLVSIKYL